MTTFGEKLKKLRIEHGISQKKMAGDIGTNQTRVSAWELREFAPSGDVLNVVARYYNVPMSSFFDEPTDATQGVSVAKYVNGLRLYSPGADARFTGYQEQAISVNDDIFDPD